MTAYIGRRLILVIPVLLGISIVTFSMIRLIPGDPALVMLGEHATVEARQAFKKRMGLDQPLPVQYARYVRSLATLDLGRAIRTGRPVISEIRDFLPATVELTLGALTFAITLGVLLGVIAAYRHNTLVDLGTMVGALVGVSMPVFWLGLMLIYFVGVKLRWLPPSARLTIGVPYETITQHYAITGAMVPWTDFLSRFYLLGSLVTGQWKVFKDALSHLILPSIALGTIPLSLVARMTRSSLLEVLHQDYMRTARAKGLAERVLLLRHALKNAFLPVITIIGLQLGLLLSGAILTETIFSWPGMGRYVVERVLGRDYPAVQGAVLLIASLFVFVNLLVDLSYAYLDPRIRYE